MLDRYRKEAYSALLPPDENDGNDLRFDVSVLQANDFIQGIWKESLRLYSASAAARIVTRDQEIEGYMIRKGSVVLLPVRLMHFNQDVFESPDDFSPERWITPDDTKAEAEKQQLQRSSLRAFGGGTGLCSGRFAAEVETLSTATYLVFLFDFELLPGQVPMIDPRALGIMSTLGDPKVKVRKRLNPRSI